MELEVGAGALTGTVSARGSSAAGLVPQQAIFQATLTGRRRQGSVGLDREPVIR